MEVFDLDLGPYGAAGFTLQDRIDLTGHQTGRVDPHINTNIVDPNGAVLGYGQRADFRDLTHNQLPGFNGMQS